MNRATVLRTNCARPARPLAFIADAFRAGWSLEKVIGLTRIDPWFLAPDRRDLVEEESKVQPAALESLDVRRCAALKRKGFADGRLAQLLGIEEAESAKRRHKLALHPVYKRVDTCAAEFASTTAYMYSTYEEECEADPSDAPQDHDPRRRSEPHRAGHRVRLLLRACRARAAGRRFETIMVNCNPETVSTDYDTSDRLYFEPLTLEDVMEIIAKEKPEGVIVQYGGQTPLKLSRALARRARRSSARRLTRSISPRIVNASSNW